MSCILFRSSYDQYLAKSNLCDWADVYMKVISAANQNDELALEMKQCSFLLCNISSNIAEVCSIPEIRHLFVRPTKLSLRVINSLFQQSFVRLLSSDKQCSKISFEKSLDDSIIETSSFTVTSCSVNDILMSSQGRSIATPGADKSTTQVSRHTHKYYISIKWL